MKTNKYTLSSIFLLLALCISPLLSQAQEAERKASYLTGDWQIAVPFGDFASKTSGWGSNIEFGYYVTPKVSVGAFTSWHTNNKYVDRQTYSYAANSSRYLFNPGAINTDAQTSLFQLPFGALIRYDFMNGQIFAPYGALKIGANYSEQTIYFQDLEVDYDNWGFYVSPELGVNIYPTPSHLFGFHVAVGFNFATNQNDALDINGLSGVAIRIGATFGL